MADKAPGKQPRKGSNVPPRNINVVNTERRQIPSSSVGPYPPIRVRGTMGHPPYYVPGTYPSRNITSPMEQMYRHPHLQPVPDVRLVDLQPPGQRHSQPASVQDGRGLFFYDHAVLTPIPERQTSPFVKPGRAFPVSSVPTNKVVKKAEHQRIVKTRTNVAHREVEDGGRPTPKTLVTTQNDISKLKYMKKTMKTNSDTLGTGEGSTPVKEKMKIFIPETKPVDKKRKRNLDRELSGSHSRDLQTGLNNSETMDQKTSKEQLKDKAKANANPAGIKEEKKAKIEAEPALPCKKIPSVTSHKISKKTPTMLPRPLPRPLPQPLPKPVPILPKPPSRSLPRAQSSSLPKPVISLSKPTPVSGPFWMQATGTQSSQFSLWRAQPRDTNETPVPSRLPALQRRGPWSTRNQVPSSTPITGFHPSTLHNEYNFLPSCPGRSSSPVQEFDGATFIPWMTPPNDLEVSSPISEQQRPIRDMMKQQAQREREEAAHWTSLGRQRYFAERETERIDSSNPFRCPWWH